MIRWLRVWIRRWRVRHDLYTDQPERHPALSQVTVGELLPFKGINWRVAAVREQPIAALVLVPISETRASKVQHLRHLRRADETLTTLERQQKADRPKYIAAQERAGRRG